MEIKMNYNILIIITIILLSVSFLNFITATTITGKSITGTVGLCFNTPPSISSVSEQNINHNETFTLQISATDSDGHSLLYSDNVSLFEIENETGLINFTPSIIDTGNYSILISVQDYTSDCPFTKTVSFELEINNSAPILLTNIPDQTWEENVELTGLNLNTYFTDPDNDSLNFTVSYGANMTINISNNGTVTFTPDSNTYGLSWAIFTANDSISTTNSNNVTLNVTHDDGAPIITIENPNVTQLSPKLETLLNVSISESGTIWYELNNEDNVTLCTSCTSKTRTLNISSFGLNNLIVYANDSSGNENSSSLTFDLVQDSDKDGIPDSSDSDADNDGVDDTDDFLIGNTSNVNLRDFEYVGLTVNGSTNLSQEYTGLQLVNFTNTTHPLVEFYYNFSLGNELNLPNITLIKQQSLSSLGGFVVKGVTLSAGQTKTIYIDKVNNSNVVCVKDAEISAISDISSSCNGVEEYAIACPGTNSSYTCSDVDTQYKVTGLSHSGGVEIARSTSETPETPSASTSTGGGGSSGGGGMVRESCEELYICEEWSPKICERSEFQQRECTFNAGNCNSIQKTEVRTCECQSRWQCTIWLPEICPILEVQKRTCLDLNKCGTESILPLEKKCEHIPADLKDKEKSIFGGAIFQSLDEINVGSIMFVVTFMILFIIAGIIYAIHRIKMKEREEMISVKQ